MEILNYVEGKMKKAVAVLEENLKTTRTDIAHVSPLDHVQLEYYGNPTPINQVASVEIVGGRQLVIKPYDRGTLKDIGRMIQTSDTGLVSQSDGEAIRLNVSALTEERRKELAKSAHKMGGEAKIAIRSTRRDADDAMKKGKELAEDLKKDTQERIQKLMDKTRKSVDFTVNTEVKETTKV